jgi:hypothetical protein
MSACNGKSSTGLPSPSLLYSTFGADPSTPVSITIQMTFMNGKTAQGRACEIRDWFEGFPPRLRYPQLKPACERKKGSLVTCPPTLAITQGPCWSYLQWRLCLLVISCPSLPPSLPGSRTGRARSKIVSSSYDVYSPSNVQPRKCKTTGKSSPGTSIPSLVPDHLPEGPVAKDKCSRALSVSLAGGSRKNPRLKQPRFSDA